MYVFKLFYHYVEELNKWKKFEAIYKNNLLVLDLFLFFFIFFFYFLFLTFSIHLDKHGINQPFPNWINGAKF